MVLELLFGYMYMTRLSSPLRVFLHILGMLVGHCFASSPGQRLQLGLHHSNT